MKPHQKSAGELLAELKTSRQGLSVEEAQVRLLRYGPNELVEKKRKTAFMMFLDQFRDFMILVLIAAAVVSGIIGEPLDTLAIVVIVLLNAVLGFTQEYRAEKAMTALRKMAAASAVILRNGTHLVIPASGLVPGDIVTLEAGNVVPADMRIIESALLAVEEAALTGESLPVEKHADAIPEDMLPLGDRKNMAFKSTLVTYGRGMGVVTATGMNTELGRIATMIQEEGESKTPLQKRLVQFGRRITIAVLAICAIVFFAGLLRDANFIEMFLVAVSLAVAAIPEALPAVVTISLALGARKMVKQNALIRKLPAVETLGSVTYICTDKTGTLTLNKMTVEEIYFDGSKLRSSEFRASPHPSTLTTEEKDFFMQLRTPPSLFMGALALSNDAYTGPSGSIVGDPTEEALFSVAREQGFEKDKLEKDFLRVAELPFDSERKLMTTFHQWPVVPRQPFMGSGNYISFTKGAVEVLVERSESVLSAEGVKPINRREIEKIGERIAADGLRVMAIGMRIWQELPDESSRKDAETGLILLGLMGMLDPPREEAEKSVALCRSAGITPVMITGDHPLTAKTIARRVGILDSDDPNAIITGRELDVLSVEEFGKRVESIRVYARVAPEQKLKIVRALQEKGHFVAMTGDGVNDAPALKRADIGIAMGITGTDVSKEASSMILLDDNFATIVKAVKEGRNIYDNIRKFIRYLLTTNSGEIWTLFLAPFAGLPIPIQPIHILWINLVTDGLPALALSVEPEERNVMKRPPRHPQETIFSHGLGAHAIWVGLLMAGVTLSLQAWAINVVEAHWQTMVFTTLCFLQLGHVMAIRSEKESLFRQGFLSNKPLLVSVVATVFLQLLTIYVPVLNPIFKTQPLSAGELLLVLFLSTSVFFAVEIEKYFKRKKECNNSPDLKTR
ncbi:MAG: cation-translocating P-type ATPase [Syntrophales bacterium]|nr:cation-translocating P-type ATPase [Syntrophales bacterium]